jgi:uncharacterized protein (UPF0332 family)
MKETTVKLLEKAERAIETTRQMLRIGDMEAAMARAYYALFYVAEALLYERGLSFRKHSGVHGAFGRHFAKSGEMDARYHKWLLTAFDKRIIADYGVEATLTEEEVREAIEHAEEFLREARQHIRGVE